MSTLTDLSAQFITHGRYLRGWSPKTIRTYQQSFTVLPTTPVHELSRASLSAVVVAMRERGLSNGGINVRLRSINSFLTWLHEEGHSAERFRVRLLPKSTAVLVTFSDAEVRRVLALRSAMAGMARVWTLFVVLVDTGVRIEEALTLEQRRVDLDGLTVTVRGKGSRERVVPISPECRKALFRLTAKQPGRFVFSAGEGDRLVYRNAIGT